MSVKRFPALPIALLTLLTGCGQDNGRDTEAEDRIAAVDAAPAEPSPAVARIAADNGGERMVTYTEERAPCLDYTPLRQPLYGDLHVHTNFSFDAAANTIGATPEDAHRFAQGHPIDFWPLDENGKPAGKFAIDHPLDFLAVTDHGEFLGERALCRTPGSPRYDTEPCALYRSDERLGMTLLAQSITTENPERIGEICGDDGALCRAAAHDPWTHMREAAEAAYDRSEQCAFTSFVGYEYTGTPGVSNYHRNVVFRNANVPELPVSYIDAPVDSELWRQLDATCDAADGCGYLTIPHNSNLANGRMAPYRGISPTLENRRAYADVRLEREPIIEIFQHKGASECINGLGSVLGAPDELCDIEAVRVMGREETYAVVNPDDPSLPPEQHTMVTEDCADGVGTNGMVGAGCVDETDFVRSALLVGLREENETGANPVKLGIIASTDTHTATPGAVVEADYRGAVTGEATPAERLQPGLLTSGPEGNPGGLAGVWAVENSRDAIFEAMLRREVFGTSGPRIAPRFFGGWNYADDLCDNENMVAVGYADGVPMGGDLPPLGVAGEPGDDIVTAGGAAASESQDVGAAGADASGAALAADAAARAVSLAAQDIKPKFIAFAARDPADMAMPLEQLQLIKGWIDADGAMHSSVRTIVQAHGAAEGAGSLCAVVTDEDFDATQSAYYYLRALELPTHRWSSYDCERLGPEAPPICSDGSLPEMTVEMAWSSPIWYRP